MTNETLTRKVDALRGMSRRDLDNYITSQGPDDFFDIILAAPSLIDKIVALEADRHRLERECADRIIIGAVSSNCQAASLSPKSRSKVNIEMAS